MRYANINGRITAADTASVNADNSAFRYGLGLFETMLVQSGGIRLGQYHWERLFAGLKQLCFELPPHFTAAMLQGEVLKTVSKNKLDHLCRVRLQLFAGSGGIFGPDSRHPLFVIECYPLEAETLQLNDNGLIAGIATGIHKSADSLSNLKSCNALIYAMAARQAKENKWNDALVCNTSGNVIESVIANIFWIKDGIVYTPPLTEGCIAGVMRRHILQTVQNITEQPLARETLLTADEVFLTNAIKGIKWVKEIENARFGCSRTAELHRTLLP